jgi:hypothetical protein
MENAELIKELKKDLDALLEQKNNKELGELIRIVTRSINRLTTDNADLNLRLKKVAADLTNLYTSQLQYWELRNKAENPGLKVKPDFDESFFRSAGVLKTELYTLLDKL